MLLVIVQIELGGYCGDRECQTDLLLTATIQHERVYFGVNNVVIMGVSLQTIGDAARPVKLSIQSSQKVS